MNPYDACVVNIMINGKQNTVAFNFGDLKSIHVNPKFNDDLRKWLEETCGSDDIGNLEASRGPSW